MARSPSRVAPSRPDGPITQPSRRRARSPRLPDRVAATKCWFACSKCLGWSFCLRNHSVTLRQGWPVYVDPMSEAAANGNVFQALDDSKISRFQIKTMFVSGMGFFTDAYDLFVIGIVVSLLKDQWSLSTSQVSWLNSATLLASAFGAIIFGRVADMLGRKRIYGYEVLILAAGAIASAFSPNYTFLLVSRIVLGVGIGGDYPVSATIMSEYSGKRSRGRMVGLVFAMQGAGLIVGPLLASILLASGISENLTWRILLGLGAIPGLAVYYLRRQIHERSE